VKSALSSVHSAKKESATALPENDTPPPRHLPSTSRSAVHPCHRACERSHSNTAASDRRHPPQSASANEVSASVVRDSSAPESTEPAKDPIVSEQSPKWTRRSVAPAIVARFRLVDEKRASSRFARSSGVLESPQSSKAHRERSPPASDAPLKNVLENRPPPPRSPARSTADRTASAHAPDSESRRSSCALERMSIGGHARVAASSVVRLTSQ